MPKGSGQRGLNCQCCASEADVIVVIQGSLEQQWPNYCLITLSIRLGDLKRVQSTNAFTVDHRPSSREGQSIRGLVVGYVSTRRDPCSAPASQLCLCFCRLPGSRVRFKLCAPGYQIRGRIVVSISACHAEDLGSIPGRGFFSFKPCGMRATATGQLRSRRKNSKAFTEVPTSVSMSLCAAL